MIEELLTISTEAKAKFNLLDQNTKARESSQIWDSQSWQMVNTHLFIHNLQAKQCGSGGHCMYYSVAALVCPLFMMSSVNVIMQ